MSCCEHNLISYSNFPAAPSKAKQFQAANRLSRCQMCTSHSFSLPEGKLSFYMKIKREPHEASPASVSFYAYSSLATHNVGRECQQEGSLLEMGSLAPSPPPGLSTQTCSLTRSPGDACELSSLRSAAWLGLHMTISWGAENCSPPRPPS